jgi:RNA polymerase sigma factor (sigma-70 family)
MSSSADPETLTTMHVRGAVAGRPESLEWVVLHFSPFLLAQANYRLGPHLAAQGTSAEDIVSEAWLATLPRLEDLRARNERLTPVLIKFLSTTIRQLASEALRRALKQRSIIPARSAEHSTVGEALDLIATRVRGGLSGLEDSETAALIVQCLGELEPELRDVVILRGVEGLGNREAAAELEELPNTVSHRYHRAIEKLRRSLPPSLFEELFASPFEA